jgi:predicted permease
MDAVKKVLLFFPLHAFALGVLLNVGGATLRGLPADLVNVLATINSPLMLLGLGIYLELDISWQERKVVAVHMVYKFLAGILVALLVLWLLPYRGPLRAVMFLFPLMPSALSSLLYSVEQGLNPRLAAMLVSASMLISLVILTVALLGFGAAF